MGARCGDPTKNLGGGGFAFAGRCAVPEIATSEEVWHFPKSKLKSQSAEDVVVPRSAIKSRSVGRLSDSKV
jgi:hypothetical protein